MKRRPPYYSKLLALCSMIRAYSEIEDGQAELIFLNDGPIPPNRLRVMGIAGEIVSKANLGNKGSIRAALEMSSRRSWASDDLVWLAEDDYLYLPQSLNDLVTAAKSLPEFDYFGLYALIGNRQPSGLPHIDSRVPKDWRCMGGETEINGHIWRAALSTTSTFGARVKVLLSDRRMMEVAMETGSAFDHAICLAYQGFNPFPNHFLIESIQQANGAAAVVRAGLLAGLRWASGFYFYWWQRRSAVRKLVSADPALISHLESDGLAHGTDWSEVAEDVRRWAAQPPYSCETERG